MDINKSGAVFFVVFFLLFLKISFEEFLNYINILLYGSDNAKAYLSFRILDIGNKSVIVI